MASSRPDVSASVPHAWPRKTAVEDRIAERRLASREHAGHALAYGPSEDMSSLEDLRSGTVEAALIASAGEAFIVADADGVIRFWKPAAERMSATRAIKPSGKRSI